MADTHASTASEAPTVQAHRGFAGIAPENTLLAARTAAERLDAGWIEIDVRPTADGTVVCFHDDALHATEDSRGITDATGRVQETDTDTVLGAEVLDSGETIPTFAGLLAALPSTVGLNVELKNPGADAIAPDRYLDADELDARRDLWSSFVDDVVSELEGHERPAVLSSSCEGAIAAVADRAPSVPTAVIVRYDLAVGDSIAERHDADAVNPRASLVLDAGEEYVAAAHDAGRSVNAWTIREWTTARDLAAIGVDGLIADYPFLDATL